MIFLFFGLAAFVLGTIIGSFLNVCIYRLPRGESIVYPPSHCPRCYQPIRWEDNLPVVSWFLLGGRCRSCKGRISLIYPTVEFLTGALFFLYYWRLVGFEEQPTAGQIAFYVVHIAFVGALLVATVIDFKHFLIPDEISMPGLLVGLAASFALPDMHPELMLTGHAHVDSLIASAIGAAAGAAIIYGLGIVGKVMFQQEAMGFGDVKLMAMIGAVLGWQLVIFVVCLSAVLGMAYGIVQMAFKGTNKIPYGPFLSAGAAAALLLRKEVYSFLESVIASYRFLFR